MQRERGARCPRTSGCGLASPRLPPDCSLTSPLRRVPPSPTVAEVPTQAANRESGVGEVQASRRAGARGHTEARSFSAYITAAAALQALQHSNASVQRHQTALLHSLLATKRPGSQSRLGTRPAVPQPSPRAACSKLVPLAAAPGQQLAHRPAPSPPPAHNAHSGSSIRKQQALGPFSLVHLHVVGVLPQDDHPLQCGRERHVLLRPQLRALPHRQQHRRRVRLEACGAGWGGAGCVGWGWKCICGRGWDWPMLRAQVNSLPVSLRYRTCAEPVEVVHTANRCDFRCAAGSHPQLVSQARTCDGLWPPRLRHHIHGLPHPHRHRQQLALLVHCGCKTGLHRQICVHLMCYSGAGELSSATAPPAHARTHAHPSSPAPVISMRGRMAGTSA